MIWIYTAQGLVGHDLVSYLSSQLSPDTLYNVSETNPTAPCVSPTEGISWLQHHADEVEFCLFLATDKSAWKENHTESTQAAFKQIWRQCVQHEIPFIYLTSYETYSQQEQPWNDNELTLPELSPSSAFGRSCHELDSWVNRQTKKPYFWAGLKLAEVYRFTDEGSLLLDANLVPSSEFDYIPLIALGDISPIVWYLMRSRKGSGLYNITSPEYLVTSSLHRVPEIRRMDRIFSMNYQKLRNLPFTLRLSSFVAGQKTGLSLAGQKALLTR